MIVAVDRRPVPQKRLEGFTPATGLSAWVQQTMLAPGGPLHNPDHAHLVYADLAFLWAPGAVEKAGRTVPAVPRLSIAGACGCCLKVAWVCILVPVVL